MVYSYPEVIMSGREGSDTYIFSVGSGNYAIDDYASDYTTTIDIVKTGVGITLQSLLVLRNGNDLLLDISGREDQLLVKNWYNGDANKVEQFRFSDCTVLTSSQIESKSGLAFFGQGTGIYKWETALGL